MSLLETLNPLLRNDKTWAQKVIPRDLFFQLLHEGTKEGFLAARAHLSPWFKCFNLLRQKQAISEPELGCLISQWQHAVKLFVCAEFIARHRSGVNQIPACEERPDELISKIRDQVKRISVGTVPIEIDDAEILTMCWLFADRSSRHDAVEVPFATASTGDSTGMLHLLRLAKVETFGLVQPDPAIFPRANRPVFRVATDFAEAIKTAFLLNEKPWNDEQLDERFGAFHRYGIVWEVKPFHGTYETAGVAVRSTMRNAEARVSPSHSPETINTLYGDSVGLAAFVGIYHALRGTLPDDRVLFSARLERRTGIGAPVGKIGSVAGIPRKLEAAMASKKIDTFVLHEGNFQHHEGAGKSEERKEIERLLTTREGFVLTVLDSTGKQTYAFPRAAFSNLGR